MEQTIEKVDGVRPYSPLELAGRNIYVREGCYLCHSQQVRPFRDEAERYGHYSLAAESMYDHPFQWGSKRTGPDLARVGGKYSNDWHVAHLIDPRSVVPELIMPPYAFLAHKDLHLRRHRRAPEDAADDRRALQRRARSPTRQGGSGRRRPTPRPAIRDADAQALPEGRGRRLRRRSGADHRDGCASSPTCRCWARWSTSTTTDPRRTIR